MKIALLYILLILYSTLLMTRHDINSTNVNPQMNRIALSPDLSKTRKSHCMQYPDMTGMNHIQFSVSLYVGTLTLFWNFFEITRCNSV